MIYFQQNILYFRVITAISLSLVFGLLSVVETIAQDAQCVVNGQVKSIIDGKPISGEIKFFINGEQKAKSKLNNGEFSAVLPLNSLVSVLVSNAIVSPETNNFSTPSSYQDINFNINVTPITEGMPIGQGVAFEVGKSDLTQVGKAELNKMVTFAKENINVYFRVQANCLDTYLNDKKEKKTELVGKKKKVTTVVTKAEEQAKILVAERLKNVQDYVLSITPRKNFFAFEELADYSKIKPKPIKSVKGKAISPQQAPSTLLITVSKVRKDG